MGLRFRKSIKIAPGVKLNLGSKSAGVSVGGKYGGVSVNSKTGARARVSAPGTGLSYSEKIGEKTSDSAKKVTFDPDELTWKAVADMTPDELLAEIKKYQKNQKFVKIAYPILALAFFILWRAIGSILCLLAAVLMLGLAIKLPKTYTRNIDELQKQLDSANEHGAHELNE